MKNLFIASFFVLAFSFNAFAKLAIVPIDELIKESDLIVVGTLTSILEKNVDFAVHGTGEIVVEKIVAGDRETAKGFLIKRGDRLLFGYIEGFPCVMGSHKRIENEKGIFFLTFDDKGEIKSESFRPLNDLSAIKNLLKKGITPRESLKTVKLQNAAPNAPQPVSFFTPYDNCSSKRAAEIFSVKMAFLVFLSSILLYWILYRSRFKIR
jgi:hypothetical protein